MDIILIVLLLGVAFASFRYFLNKDNGKPSVGGGGSGEQLPGGSVE